MCGVSACASLSAAGLRWLRASSTRRRPGQVPVALEDVTRSSINAGPACDAGQIEAEADYLVARTVGG